MMAMDTYLQKLNMLLRDLKATFLNLPQLVRGPKRRARNPPPPGVWGLPAKQ